MSDSNVEISSPPPLRYSGYNDPVTRKFATGNPGKPVGAVSTIGHVKKVCDEHGFDWVVEAINRFRDPKVPHSDRTQCLQMIADRIAPKLKAIELRGEGQTALQQVLINVIAGLDPQAIEAPATDNPQLITDQQDINT